MADADVPLAVRRPRRSNGGVANQSQPDLPSLPKTPRRVKRGVRFSDPGPSLAGGTELSSGLTPMIRRTTIATPGRRRSSTPGRASGSGTPAPRAPALLSAARPLRQTTDGRVQRRIRRANFRELLNKLEQQKKRSARLAQVEMANLRSELEARDREIYEMQNATVVIDTERIWDLEQQVEDLRDELETRAASTPCYQTRSHVDWTLAARDPFSDDFMSLAPDEDHFGNATMAQLASSTPSRARSSFPTPPATSPVVPGPATPCRRARAPTPRPHAAVQACLPSLAQQQLEHEVASLRLEVGKLTTTLETYEDLGRRIAARMSSVASPAAAGETAETCRLEALERQVESLVQTMSDRTAALTLLNSSLADLGFPGNDAGEIVTALASGFRAARLELEYLTPGEVALPLTSHGAEVLDLLLTRLRAMAKKVQEDEASIDEYHEIEQSLRQQLDARVSVMDGLKAEMRQAEGLMNDKNTKIRELQIGNDRLRGAVDGYIRDISELEQLVERMEQTAKDAEAEHRAQTESYREGLAAKDAAIAVLEDKLADAMRQTARLQQEIGAVQDSTTRHVVSLNKQHGAALALRDARVLELRGEVDRVNASLLAAHETIRVLRVDNSNLAAQTEEDRLAAKAAMDAMKEELQRVLQMSQEFLDSPKRRSREEHACRDADKAVRPRPVVRQGGYLAANLARRGSKEMRRRHDSGLVLLAEDEVDM